VKGFTTTDDGGWIFDLSDPEPPKVCSDTLEMAPILGTAAHWENFGNTGLYNWEKLIREWILKHAENAKWARTTKERRYTLKMVVEEITGEPYEQAKYAKDIVWIKKMLEYYSTHVQKGATINGKKYTKTVYTVSPNRVKKQKPYSLKLRLEMYREQGIIPSVNNMKIPHDKMLCKPGHAINARTNANMEKRSQLARERYNERYKDRKH
jgi:hypothetical protein